jgi:hypothetical protein
MSELLITALNFGEIIVHLPWQKEAFDTIRISDTDLNMIFFAKSGIGI